MTSVQEKPVDVAVEHAGGFADDPRWQLVQSIVQTTPFVRSPRISQLTLHLAAETLSGRSDQLTEGNIARDIFERVGSFDPAVDTIVRSHMVRLRQKLQEYASTADPSSEWSVDSPRGTYALQFVRRQQPPAPQPIEEQAVPEPPRRDSLKLLCLCLALACAVLLGIIGWHFHRARVADAPAHVAPHLLWDRFFAHGSRPTLVAADSALVAFHSITNSQTTLYDYVHHDFDKYESKLDQPMRDIAVDIRNRRYTSFVDLGIARNLTLLADARSATLTDRFARDLNVGDLKSGNWILSGDGNANPWVSLFEPSMNFVERRAPDTHRTYMLNRQPRAGESQTYVYSPTTSDHKVFGVLALLPNLSNTGDVLIIEGTSLAGTEAVSDFLFNDAVLLPFLKSIENRDGTIPHFEVLLEAKNFNGDAARATIQAFRVSP